MTNELMSKYNNTGAGQKRKFPEILLKAITRKTVLFELYVAKAAVYFYAFRMCSAIPKGQRNNSAARAGRD